LGAKAGRLSALVTKGVLSHFAILTSNSSADFANAQQIAALPGCFY
jgi:hypothetical protein